MKLIKRDGKDIYNAIIKDFYFKYMLLFWAERKVSLIPQEY